MEASSPSAPRGGPIASAPVWVLAALPLALIAAAFAAFALLGGPGLDDRRGPPVEELADGVKHRLQHRDVHERLAG